MLRACAQPVRYTCAGITCQGTFIPPMLLLPTAALPEEDANTRALGHNSSQFSE